MTLSNPFDIFLGAKQQKLLTFLTTQDSPHVSGMCELGPQKRSLLQQKSFASSAAQLSRSAVPIQSTFVSVKNTFWSNVTNSDSLTSSSSSFSTSKLSRAPSKSTLGRWQCNFDYLFKQKSMSNVCCDNVATPWNRIWKNSVVLAFEVL